MAKKYVYSDLLILQHIIQAASESAEMQARWRTDLVGIARQYGGYRIPRNRYEDVLNKPIHEILTQHKDYVDGYIKTNKSFRSRAETIAQET